MTLLNCEECDEVSLNEKYIETKPSPELRKVFLETDWSKFRDAFVWLNREDRYLPNQMGLMIDKILDAACKDGLLDAKKITRREDCFYKPNQKP